MDRTDATSAQVSDLVKSLLPRDVAELSLLRRVIRCAQLMQKGAPSLIRDLADTESVFVDVLESLSGDARRYFHGLVEALDVYQSINGKGVLAQGLTLSDTSVLELKQIRDLCLEQGLSTVY